MYYSSRIFLSHDIQVMAGMNINLHMDAWKSISLISYFPVDCPSFFFLLQPAIKTICILKTKQLRFAKSDEFGGTKES